MLFSLLLIFYYYYCCCACTLSSSFSLYLAIKKSFFLSFFLSFCFYHCYFCRHTRYIIVSICSILYVDICINIYKNHTIYIESVGEWVIWSGRIEIPFSLQRKVMRAVCQKRLVNVFFLYSSLCFFFFFFSVLCLLILLFLLLPLYSLCVCFNFFNNNKKIIKKIILVFTLIFIFLVCLLELNAF